MDYPKQSHPRWRLELGDLGRRAGASGEAEPQTAPRTIVIGHRNPDTDSVAAAYAYAELKRLSGDANVIAAIPGLPTLRTEFLFNKFHVALPVQMSDLSRRVSDVMDPRPLTVAADGTLMDVLDALQTTRQFRIAVVEADGRFLGMLSLFDLAGRLFQRAVGSGKGGGGKSLIGREVTTSIRLAAAALAAEILGSPDPDKLLTYDVYVGAMSVDKLRATMRRPRRNRLALVVGDRLDVQELAVELKIPLLVITGASQVSAPIVEKALANGCSVLQTPFDSATTVRRLKFSAPARLMTQLDMRVFSAEDRLSDIFKTVIASHEDSFPVTDTDGRLAGVFTKYDLEREPSTRLILVDHNEIEQAVEGAAELPIVEVIDHHRIGMRHTEAPLTVHNDVVGSTCTLIAEFYRRQGLVPEKATAGVLLGGIITDTICLRSPTTSDRDRGAVDWLKGLAECSPAKLAEEILNVGSLIAEGPAHKVIATDRKNYSVGSVTFAISQVEEAGFENFSAKRAELLVELEQVVDREHLDLVCLLVTNVVRETSVMLVAGRKPLIDKLPWPRLDSHLFELRGVMSRKKQLLPKLLQILG